MIYFFENISPKLGPHRKLNLDIDLFDFEIDPVNSILWKHYNELFFTQNWISSNTKKWLPSLKNIFFRLQTIHDIVNSKHQFLFSSSAITLDLWTSFFYNYCLKYVFNCMNISNVEFLRFEHGRGTRDQIINIKLSKIYKVIISKKSKYFGNSNCIIW